MGRKRIALADRGQKYLIGGNQSAVYGLYGTARRQSMRKPWETCLEHRYLKQNPSPNTALLTKNGRRYRRLSPNATFLAKVG